MNIIRFGYFSILYADLYRAFRQSDATAPLSGSIVYSPASN
jgi:hypothetical protein